MIASLNFAFFTPLEGEAGVGGEPKLDSSDVRAMENFCSTTFYEHPPP
jgi:hypothetical protein